LYVGPWAVFLSGLFVPGSLSDTSGHQLGRLMRNNRAWRVSKTDLRNHELFF
jgi:hypothetical protein